MLQKVNGKPFHGDNPDRDEDPEWSECNRDQGWSSWGFWGKVLFCILLLVCGIWWTVLSIVAWSFLVGPVWFLVELSGFVLLSN